MDLPQMATDGFDGDDDPTPERVIPEYEVIEKGILEAVGKRYCTRGQMHKFLEQKLDTQLVYEDLQDVLDGMLCEKKLATPKGGTITAYFTPDSIPSRFWLGGDGRVAMEFNGHPVAYIPKELKDTALPFNPEFSERSPIEQEFERLSDPDPVEGIVKIESEVVAKVAEPESLAITKPLSAGLKQPDEEYHNIVILQICDKCLVFIEGTCVKCGFQKPGEHIVTREADPVCSECGVPRDHNASGKCGDCFRKTRKIEIFPNDLQAAIDAGHTTLATASEYLGVSVTTFHKRLAESNELQATWDGRVTEYPAIDHVHEKTERHSKQKNGKVRWFCRPCGQTFIDPNDPFPVAKPRGRVSNQLPTKREFVTSNEVRGVPDFVLCPPVLEISLEHEIATASAFRKISADDAAADIHYRMYQTKWQSTVIPKPAMPDEKTIDDLCDFIVDHIDAMIDETFISEADAPTVAVMWGTFLFGFREASIRKVFGFDRYFIEAVLVRMMDCFFWRKNGNLIMNWPDPEHGGWEMLLDVLAVHGETDRHIDAEGCILYQKKDLEAVGFRMENMPIKCKCEKPVSFAAWKDQMKARLKSFQCADCFNPTNAAQLAEAVKEYEERHEPEPPEEGLMSREETPEIVESPVPVLQPCGPNVFAVAALDDESKKNACAFLIGLLDVKIMSLEEQDAVRILVNFLKGIPNPPTEKAADAKPFVPRENECLQIPKDQVLVWLLNEIASDAKENDTLLQLYSEFGEYVLNQFIEQLGGAVNRT